MNVPHPEQVCERCHGSNVTWFAPSALWNKAHGDYDILCPVCFITLAEAAGIKPTSWVIAPETHDDSDTMTPLGGRAHTFSVDECCDRCRMSRIEIEERGAWECTP